MKEQRVTTDEAAELLGIPASTIASWKHDRRITPVGLIPGRGRGGQVPIYLLSELEPLAEAWRRRAAARHARRGAGAP